MHRVRAFAPDVVHLAQVWTRSFGGGANANSRYNVNGLRSVYNNFLLDGVAALRAGLYLQRWREATAAGDTAGAALYRSLVERTR